MNDLQHQVEQAVIDTIPAEARDAALRAVEAAFNDVNICLAPVGVGLRLTLRKVAEAVAEAMAK